MWLDLMNIVFLNIFKLFSKKEGNEGKKIVWWIVFIDFIWKMINFLYEIMWRKFEKVLVFVMVEKIKSKDDMYFL